MDESKILFEDEDVVVIDKPSGLRVHGDGRSTTPTVVQWFLHHAPSAQGVGEQETGHDGVAIERSGVVHRLDTDTSGVMVLAKTNDAFAELKQQFKDRIIKKEYRAFVYGTIRERWGEIDRPIGRSATNFRLRSAQRGAKGTMRDAHTEWECLATGEHNGEPFSELRLMPRTGRTHQLRAHLKAINRPIVMDGLYAGARMQSSHNLGFTRLALHAHVLTVSVPSKGVQEFTAPLPNEFEVARGHIAHTR